MFLLLPRCPIWKRGEWWQRPPALGSTCFLHKQRWRLRCPCGITTTSTTPAIGKMKNTTSVIPAKQLAQQMHKRQCVCFTKCTICSRVATCSQVFCPDHPQQHRPSIKLSVTENTSDTNLRHRYPIQGDIWTYTCTTLWHMERHESACHDQWDPMRRVMADQHTNKCSYKVVK